MGLLHHVWRLLHEVCALALDSWASLGVVLALTVVPDCHLSSQPLESQVVQYDQTAIANRSWVLVTALE